LAGVRMTTGIKPWWAFSSRRLNVRLAIPYPPRIGNGLLAAGYKQ
jgi:hypothetical protein